MGSKLYVGGLPYAATETQLTSLFAAGRGAGSHCRFEWHANGRPVLDRQRSEAAGTSFRRRRRSLQRRRTRKRFRRSESVLTSTT
jgi:hypothetical protein